MLVRRVFGLKSSSAASKSTQDIQKDKQEDFIDDDDDLEFDDRLEDALPLQRSADDAEDVYPRKQKTTQSKNCHQH